MLEKLKAIIRTEPKPNETRDMIISFIATILLLTFVYSIGHRDGLTYKEEVLSRLNKMQVEIVIIKKSIDANGSHIDTKLNAAPGKQVK